ncbi:hypothetical protein [Bythopirellula polymerisocia]|uniref:hypothetical protein n=1 Tax=Bythopirellula polymerisocia TaxID=2528003 RepID=UPI0011B5509A|nr:hypothetical protein [Bythopirellula polymerisocia]
MRFDSGPPQSVIADQSIALNLSSRYQTTLGFGWITSPRDSFVRADLSRSRSALTIDGVVGEEFDFRADIAAGDWIVTIWLEMGEFDHNATQISIQGQPCVVDWQEFPAAAEPSQNLPKLYRVFHTTAQVGSDGLILKFQGKDSDVRLLGISLMRQQYEYTPVQLNFLAKIKSNLSLNNYSSLPSLIQEVKTAVLANPTDSVLALWLQRMEFLAAAEKYYEMRGWEWAEGETRLSMFDRHHQAIMLLDGILAGQKAVGEPLADPARYLRGRLLYWLGKERGGSEVIANANHDLKLLYQNYPEDDLLAMYASKQIDSQDDCDCLESSPEAPAWSVLQHEALCRLRAIIRWWTTERQIANGEFGGKFGDDVELLRWWAPLCLAGDQTALQGWKLLADGVWHSKHVNQGYARKLADVEHSSEFISDTAPLMVFYSDEPEYLTRLQPSAQLFQDFWTGLTPQGNRFFRSAWFSATDLETTEPKGRDVEFNCRAAKAVRYLVGRRPDPQLVATLHEWSMAWVEASLSTEKGKPRGIFPASIRFEDESINGDGKNWYQADMYWDYYDWYHSAGSLLLDQVFYTYLLTRDERLLEPLLLTLDLIRSQESQALESNHPEGSPAWAAQILRNCSLFWEVIEQWRFTTRNQTFDDLIMLYGSPYGRYRVSGDERHLVEGLNTLLDDVRFNTPLKTNEALFTDRVYVAESEALKGMLTGDGIPSNTSPYFYVSWEHTDGNFTALVVDAREEGIKVELFSHADEQREIVMRVWRVKPGLYVVRHKCLGSSIGEDVVNISSPGERISITLPPQQLLEIELSRISDPPKSD